MQRDLSFMVDDFHLNVRVGVILRYEDKTVLEVSRLGLNSVIPGGRIRIGESSRDAIIREMREEMNISLAEDRLSYVTTLENFFVYNSVKVHELFFVYSYTVSDAELEVINALSGNMDNETTYFKLVNNGELEKYDLLPVRLRDIINA